VIFTDESTFYLNQKGKKVWQFPRKRKVFRSVKHPLKINIWGYFSEKGFGKIIYFQNNLTSDFMIKIYENSLLPSIDIYFDDDNID